MRKSTLAAALAIGLMAAPAFAQEGSGDNGGDFQSFHHHHHGFHGWQSRDNGSSEESGWNQQGGSDSAYSDSDADSEGHRRRRRRRRHHHHDGQMSGCEGGRGHGHFMGQGFMGQLDPQTESQTMAFLNANLPEKARELERVKSASTEIYNREMFMMSHRVRFLQMVQERNPDQFKQMLADMKQRDAAVSASSEAVESGEATTLRGRLHNTVDQICDLGQPIPPVAAGSFLAIAAGLGGWLFYRRRKQNGLGSNPTV